VQQHSRGSRGSSALLLRRGGGGALVEVHVGKRPGQRRQDTEVARRVLVGAEGGPVAEGIQAEPQNCGGPVGRWEEEAGDAECGSAYMNRAVTVGKDCCGLWEGHGAARQLHKLRPSGGEGVVCSELRGLAAACCFGASGALLQLPPVRKRWPSSTAKADGPSR
jgi:hypothetical protein